MNKSINNFLNYIYLKKYKIIIIYSILIIALLLRIIFVFFIHPPEKYLYSDMKGYYNRAIKISKGEKEEIIDTLYPPGTHYFYSIFFKFKNAFFIIKLVNIIVSVISCFFIYLISKILFNLKSALISLFISSINYIFIDFTGYILSETPFIFTLSMMFFFLLKSIKEQNNIKRFIYSFLSGLLLIISSSIRSSILLFIPFFIVWWIFNIKKYKLYYNVFFYLLGFLPILIILSLRIYLITGSFGVISTNNGLNFFQGRSHVRDIEFYDLERGSYYLFASPVAIQKGYIKNYKFYYGPYNSSSLFEEGIKEMKKDIGRTILFSLEQILDLFFTVDIWPTFAIRTKILPNLIKYYNYIFIILVILPSIILFIIRFKKIKSNLSLLPYFFILVIILTAMIFYGDPRFRVPFDIFFIILSGYFYSNLIIYKSFK